jgi:hypothetical protein
LALLGASFSILVLARQTETAQAGKQNQKEKIPAEAEVQHFLQNNALQGSLARFLKRPHGRVHLLEAEVDFALADHERRRQAHAVAVASAAVKLRARKPQPRPRHVLFVAIARKLPKTAAPRPDSQRIHIDAAEAAQAGSKKSTCC